MAKFKVGDHVERIGTLVPPDMRSGGIIRVIPDKSGTDWLNPAFFPNRDNIASSPSSSSSARQPVADQPATHQPQGSQCRMTQSESPALSPRTDDGPSTIEGEGVLLVGLDIQPGIYRTAGPAESSRACYYALLSSTNTSDIITNNNVAGPATITIGPEVKAVHFSGCKPWHRLEIAD